MTSRITITAVLLAFAPLAPAQTQPVPGASIGSEPVRAPTPSPSDSMEFPTLSAVALGSQRVEPETCVIRPVMTDAQLKLCGATLPVYPPRKLVTDMVK